MDIDCFQVLARECKEMDEKMEIDGDRRGGNKPEDLGPLVRQSAMPMSVHGKHLKTNKGSTTFE